MFDGTNLTLISIVDQDKRIFGSHDSYLMPSFMRVLPTTYHL